MKGYYTTKAFGPIRIQDCNEVTVPAAQPGAGPCRILRVTYATETDEDLTFDLPMYLDDSNPEEGYPQWAIALDLTPSQKEMDDAIGDWCAGQEEQRQERLYDR